MCDDNRNRNTTTTTTMIQFSCCCAVAASAVARRDTHTDTADDDDDDSEDDVDDAYDDDDDRWCWCCWCWWWFGLIGRRTRSLVARCCNCSELTDTHTALVGWWWRWCINSDTEDVYFQSYTTHTHWDGNVPINFHAAVCLCVCACVEYSNIARVFYSATGRLLCLHYTLALCVRVFIFSGLNI